MEQAVSTTNALRDALDNGRTCRGIVFKIGSPDLVEIAARSGENVVPACVEAVKAYATIGEIVTRLRGVFGSWQPSNAF